MEELGSKNRRISHKAKFEAKFNAQSQYSKQHPNSSENSQGAELKRILEQKRNQEPQELKGYL